MIYHHAITAAAARQRTKDFIAQATSDARATRPTKARRRLLTVMSWLMPRRSVRVVARSTRRVTT
jgi:hypothetical protein